MISVIIPTLNDEAHLAEALTALVPAAVEGLVREVIIADGGSSDRTLEIADGAGAEVVGAGAGRGARLRAGAERARQPWLLFLNADTVLEAGWEREASLHIERVQNGRRKATAATFRLALDDDGALARVVERLAALRTALLKLPRGDQGLLVSRALYAETGGFLALPVLEDVDLGRRIGRRRMSVLAARALTVGEPMARKGSIARMVRAELQLWLHVLGLPVATIASLTGGRG